MITKKTLNNLTTSFGVLLIVGFIIYLFLDYKKNKDVKPKSTKNKIVNNMKQTYSKCPNYFEIGKDSDNCINVHKLGKCKETYNFEKIFRENSRIFNTPETKNKMKCEWAKQCEVAWDGIDRLC